MNHQMSEILKNTLEGIRSGRVPQAKTEEVLSTFIDNPQGTSAILSIIGEEDDLGKFYLLLLLQRTVVSMHGRAASPYEVDPLIQEVDRLVYLGVGEESEMVGSRLSVLYGTLLLYYWPVKMQNFLPLLGEQLRLKRRLGISILENFLSLSTDSLDITEERRYEIKKNVAAASRDISRTVTHSYPLFHTLAVLTSFARAGIVDEEISKMIFERTDLPYDEEVSVFIGELTGNVNQSLFQVVIAFLYRQYTLAKTSSILSIPEITERITLFGSGEKKRSGEVTLFDSLLREIITDFMGPLREAIPLSAVVEVAKLYNARVKAYITKKLGPFPFSASSASNAGSEEALVPVILGKEPVNFLLAVCYLHSQASPISPDTFTKTLEVLGGLFPSLLSSFLSSFHIRQVLIPGWWFLHARYGHLLQNLLLLRHLHQRLRF